MASLQGYVDREFFQCFEINQRLLYSYLDRVLLILQDGRAIVVGTQRVERVGILTFSHPHLIGSHGRI